MEKVKKLMNVKSVEKGLSVKRNVDHKGKDCDSVIRMRYGRIIRKPDRLAY